MSPQAGKISVVVTLVLNLVLRLLR